MDMRFLFAFAAIAFSSISFCADKVKDNTEAPSTNEDLMPLFQKVLHDLESEYVEDVSKEKLIEAAISGMLASLDPHSSYFNPKAVQEFKESAKGQIIGIGMEVTQENGLIKVIAPIEDAPAAVAGIQAGDYIFKIDGESILGMTLDEAVKKLRGGAVGSLVNAHIYRPQKDPFELKVKRAIIKVKTVKSRMIDNVGYVRITSFMSEKTTEMVKEALDSFKKIGKYAGLILDLRNNAGGQIEQAVGLCNFFLDGVEVVSTKGRDANKIEHFMSTSGQYIDPSIKLLVLINGGSASASEIVAGALQDHKRAIVMGTKSFGKASVQLFKPIGSRAVKYTIARYYTPLGRSIQAQGIEPDIKVEMMKFETVSDELRFREKDYKGSLKPDAGLQEVLKDEKKDKDSKEKEEKKSDEQDYQLLRAVELIKSLIITDGMSQKKPDKSVLDKTDKKDTEPKNEKSASLDISNCEKYASVFSNPDKKPTVSIVIANLGLKQDVALSAINETPSFVTLSFDPCSKKVVELEKTLAAKGILFSPLSYNISKKEK